MAFHEKGAGQLSRQTGPNVEDLASEFAKHTCSEDRMRIRDIANVNLEKTGRPPGELKNIFYKNIMQLVQNVCEQKKVLGKISTCTVLDVCIIHHLMDGLGRPHARHTTTINPNALRSLHVLLSQVMVNGEPEISSRARLLSALTTLLVHKLKAANPALHIYSAKNKRCPCKTVF